MTRNGKITPRWLHFFIIIVLVLGIFFRFVNLDRKVFWNDEIGTLSIISGYTDYKGALNGKIITISDLRKYQRPDPEISVIDIVQNVARFDPHISILYYVIARFWVEWFGSSVAVMRSLSALIGLLVFPCLYWLCLELFQSSLVGWVAV
ncbi:glycosyltransferase family 39 protein, partial [Microseira wollei]|uniref:glycosyltransferase family 39 protein n=1 Tax=Microseira wollei TaxID=467598 RepID=UPI00403985CB